MNKKSILLSALPLLLFACGKPSSPNDDANDAGGTGGAGLAREVVGVHMLSNDTNYDAPCNYLAEEFMSETFHLEGVTLEKYDEANGCEFRWGSNKVGIMMGGRRPFPSIYHAEYVFDRMYQPNAKKLATARMQASTAPTEDEPTSLNGPNTAGTAGEMPANNPGNAKRDTTAANDTASTISGITAKAAELTKPAQTVRGFTAVNGLGDKAVWEAGKQTMHVLFNNHILNIQVQTGDNTAVKQQRATTLARVMLDQLVH